MSVFSQRPQYVKPPRGRVSQTIQERFETFHRLNPWVLEALEYFAQELLDRGYARLAIGMLWENVRYQYMHATADPSSDFKLNDHYRSRYVRLLIQRHPRWDGVFELRELRAP